jgi:hypothetical protein
LCFVLTLLYFFLSLLCLQLYIENGVARTILLKPILQDFEIGKRKMVRVVLSASLFFPFPAPGSFFFLFYLKKKEDFCFLFLLNKYLY